MRIVWRARLGIIADAHRRRHRARLCANAAEDLHGEGNDSDSEGFGSPGTVGVARRTPRRRGARRGRRRGFSIGALSGIAPASPGLDMFLVLLKSRTLRAEVMEEATKTLGPAVGGKIMSVVPDTREKGLVALTVEATDPQVAAGSRYSRSSKVAASLALYCACGSFISVRLRQSCR